jgi:crotonobetainyl-CoA:carnitine CoA-transferase CaiB-like acyl-CoA transferase
MSAMLPLEGMKVLDLTRVLSGPYCTMVLADMGADVVKIERFPGGDDSRRLDPHDNGESYCFAMVNRNKRSIAVDLKSERGRALVLRMAASADVVIENFRLGVTARLGLDYAVLREHKPDLIYCSITGFGQTGPYRLRAGYDIVAQGMSGLMRMTGHPDGRPAKVGIAVNDIAAGATAVQAILAAYVHRLRTGEGQYIDLSLVDAALAWTIWESAAYFGGGEVPEATGTRHRRIAPYQAYRTRDGYVTVGANNERLWRLFCVEVVQRPVWLEDDRYRGLASRLAHVDDLQADIESVLVQETTAYWVERLEAVGVPGGPVYTYDEALRDEQVLARDMVQRVRHPRMGEIQTLGPAIKFSRTPLRLREPAPLLGQHSTEVLRELDLGEEEIEELYELGVIHSDVRSGGATKEQA